jgi:hypothetical protein
MEKINATRLLTVSSSERSSRAFGMCCVVSRTEFATEGDPLETSQSRCQLDLPTIGTQSRLVLQMAEAVSSGSSQRAAGSLARATEQSAALVGRNTPGDSRCARLTDTTSWSARTLSSGRGSDNPSRAGVSGLRSLALAAQDAFQCFCPTFQK